MIESTRDKVSTRKSFLIVGERSHSKSQPIIITGTSRGGTSLVAALLRVVGVDLGVNLPHNQEDNKFFRCFYPEFNQELFSQTVASHSTSDHYWGFKLPKAALFLPAISNICPGALFVLVFRNPFSAALGEAARGGNLQNSLMFSLRFYQSMVTFFQQNRAKHDFILCSYEQLALDSSDFALSMCKLLDVSAPLDLDARLARVNAGDGGGYVSF